VRWSASLRGRCTGKRFPGTRWIVGYMGPTVGLDAVEKRKIPALPEIEQRSSSQHPNENKSIKLGWPVVASS